MVEIGLQVLIDSHAALALLHGYGVVGPHANARLQQQRQHHQGRGLAHIVGLGLKGQPPYGHCQPLEAVLADSLLQLLEQDGLLPCVDTLHSLEHLHGIAVLIGSPYQSLDILGEAAAAIATAGIEKLAAYARVGADALAHTRHVGAHPLTKVGNVVHKGNASGQH